MCQCGFYTYSIAALLTWETRRKDFSVMMSHHVITVALIGYSYITRYYFCFVSNYNHSASHIKQFFCVFFFLSITFFFEMRKADVHRMNTCVWISCSVLPPCWHRAVMISSNFSVAQVQAAVPVNVFWIIFLTHLVFNYFMTNYFSKGSKEESP